MDAVSLDYYGRPHPHVFFAVAVKAPVKAVVVSVFPSPNVSKDANADT